MNQAINFFWTILCFIPVIAFWMGHYFALWLFSFIGISIISLWLPARLLQLSAKPRFYEQVGVKFIRKFVQDGDYINKFIRKTKPGYTLIKGRSNAATYIKTVIMYERYHFFCFVFFLLTTGYALLLFQYQLCLIITLSNIIYNICPLLLQQYNRARLMRIIK